MVSMVSMVDKHCAPGNLTMLAAAKIIIAASNVKLQAGGALRITDNCHYIVKNTDR